MSLRRKASVLVFWLWIAPVRAEDIAALGQLRLPLPPGWDVVQTAMSDGTQILVVESGSESISFFSRPGPARVQDFITGDSQTVESERRATHGVLDWNRMVTAKTPPKGTKTFVSHFLTEIRGITYHGFSRGNSADQARQNADAILNQAEIVLHTSLTDTAYTGKKFYLGWGAAMPGDDAVMHNVAKYDVLHTLGIFSTEFGGNYFSEKFTSYKDATAKNIRASWQAIKQQMTSDDMFLQYSAGHGSGSGLAVGLTYKDIRDYTLSLPAKEIVILTMACYSGALVDSFNQAKTQWQDWGKQGRSLLVMSSSTAREESGNGPSTDPSEPGGPAGSGGSAFGHAIWKALTGAADGFVDGTKDGFISLGEIRDYTRFRTQQIGGHTPQATGVFHPTVIMNRIPPPTLLALYPNGSDGMSDAQIEEAVRELDAAMAVQSASQSSAR